MAKIRRNIQTLARDTFLMSSKYLKLSHETCKISHRLDMSRVCPHRVAQSCSDFFELKSKLCLMFYVIVYLRLTRGGI